MKQIILSSSLATVLALSSGFANAATFTVSVQNLTQGLYFTPVLVAAHDSDNHLFKAGMAATPSLQAMAEGGSLDGLVSDLSGTSAEYVANPAGGLLAPGESTTTDAIDTHGSDNDYLSVVAMMLPTNDGFIGLDSYPIPTAAGTYTININGYDAGTEANDEIVNGGGAPNTPGIPAAPGGDEGSGATGAAAADTNTTVHIHRGVLGDTNATGGKSDLDSRIHRWLNPVARVTITVQ